VKSFYGFAINHLIIILNLDHEKLIIIRKEGRFKFMMRYGNEYTRLTCIIRQMHEKQAKIEFPQFGKECYVPKFFIHTPIKETPGEQQELDVETWFLKRNRIIPLV